MRTPGLCPVCPHPTYMLDRVEYCPCESDHGEVRGGLVVR